MSSVDSSGGKEYLLISLGAFFDASGAAKNAPYLTLAGMAADDSLWADFNKQWRGILDRHALKPRYIHMREADKLIGEFAQHKGWTNQKVDALVGDLLIFLSHLDKQKFRQFFCAIDMGAYRKLQVEGICLDDPIDICNKGCPEIVLAWYVTEFPGVIDSAHFFFDQDEPFEEPFRQKWTTERENVVHPAGTDIFWSIIQTVTSADMRQRPALQAADMLAWGVNRDLTSTGDRSFRLMASIMVNVIPSALGIWDEKKLRERYEKQGHGIR